jgi:hypothetical protein
VRRALLLACAALAGCVPSLHPLYTEQDGAFEPDLLGSWDDEEGRPAFEFARAGPGYDALYRAGQEPARFEGRLVRLGERTFLDLFPQMEHSGMNDLLAAHLVAAHVFFRVEVSSAELKLSALDPVWTAELLEKDPGALRHETRGDLVLLTAPTPELRAFVEKHGGDEAAFPGPGVFRRPSR